MRQLLRRDVDFPVLTVRALAHEIASSARERSSLFLCTPDREINRAFCFCPTKIY